MQNDEAEDEDEVMEIQSFFPYERKIDEVQNNPISKNES